jgi:CheY-like chemotaxis protein
MMSNTYEGMPPKKDREFLNVSPSDKLLSLTSLRVLVVDDKEDSLVLTRFILEEYAMQVMTAVSANEALQIFSQTKPDILICDIAMPGEDGYSLIRKIRKLEPEQGERIPAIALTACARNKDRILSLNAGFQMHLTKPVDPEDLVQAVAGLARL